MPIRMKERVSEDTWNAEMLCKRPSTRASVFPMFDKGDARHGRAARRRPGH